MNVLFDLDGTLTDSRQGILGSMRYALQRIGRTAPDDAVLERFIGPPTRETFQSLVGAGDAELVAAAIRFYRQRYSERGLYENVIYAGIAPLLSQLRARGWPLYIATSKPRDFALLIADHFALTPHFHAIHGSEFDGTRSAKPDLLRHVIQVEGLDPADTVMIGDREHDVRGARANRLHAVGVLWGYGSREELAAAGADALCRAPAELPGVLGLEA